MTIRLPKDSDKSPAPSLQVLARSHNDPGPANEPSGLPKSKKGMLVLPTMEGLCFERVKNVVYLEAAGNYTTLHFADGRQVLVCKTLRDVESMLPARAFARIHRSHSIHLRYIRKYVRGKGGHVVMENGVHLVVAGGQRDAFLAAVRAFFE